MNLIYTLLLALLLLGCGNGTAGGETQTTNDEETYTLSIAPSSLNITRGGSVHTLQLYVQNDQGLPVADVWVNAGFFDAAFGALSTYTQKTDAKGMAAFTYTAPQSYSAGSQTTIPFRIQNSARHAALELIFAAEQLEVEVITPNAHSDIVVPYRREQNSGDRTFELSLDAGYHLVGFSQVSYHSVDKERDALLRIEDEDETPLYYITAKSKNTLTDTASLRSLLIERSGRYRFAVDMPDTRDAWDLHLTHKSQLSDTVQGDLKDPVVPQKALGDDILYPYQWHLKNTGQSEFVLYDAVASNDINVEPVWQMGYSGKGVHVAVIDQGVEINHPDLIANIDVANSWNYLTKSYDTTPSSSANAHGTAVAGIIAAQAHNGIGGRGVAPKATLVSYNMLESQSLVDWDLASESLVRGLERVDIYNNSWGLGAGTLFPNPASEGSIYYRVATQMAYGVKHGRGGKGAIYIKSAGNDRLGYDEERMRFQDNWNANLDPDQVDRYAVIVGASNANGGYSEYSNPGANLLINAPGGDSNAAHMTLDLHQIVTTDLSGRLKGYDYQDDNLFDYHFGASGNENYDYTDRMNGTSAAGPIVAGVVALMLEANPNLTWRDVRYILALTATKNGSGYTTNAAGHRFSNDYGFGRVNAEAAVLRALTWQNLSQERSIGASASAHRSYNHAADANLSKSGAVSLHVTEELKVEYVNLQCSLDVNDTKEPAALPDSALVRIRLVSPSRTESILLDAPNGIESGAKFLRTRFGSNAFLDENAAGVWRLYVEEVRSDEAPYKDPTDLRGFILKDITLELYGREP